MAVRCMCVFTISLTKSLNFPQTVLSNSYNRTSFFLKMASHRMISKCVITPNLKLNSNNPVTLESKPDSLPIVKTDGSRSLVVLLEYMGAKEQHIKKFIDLYMNYGFDVLQIHLKPWQLLWPTKGSQIVAKDIAQFLAINKSFSPIVVHGFSVGGYLWGEVLVYFSKYLNIYQPVADKVKCKIFDSAVDVEEIPKGFPLAVFPKNQVLRSLFEKYLRYHLKAFYEESTKHYNKSRKEFSGSIVKCPTLMITSNTDPLSTVEVNEKVKKELAAVDLECHIKVFNGSTHVAHFKKHQDEYISEIEKFLKKVNLIELETLKAKL